MHRFSRHIVLLAALAAIVVLMAAPAVALAGPVIAVPGVFAQMVVGASVLSKAASILVFGLVIYAAINGIKDRYPNFAAAHPGLLVLFNAIGALLAAFLTCVGGSHPEADKSVFELIPCVGVAVMTFLTAAGIHQAKSQSDKSRAGVPPKAQ